MNEELGKFIEHAREKEVDHSTIRLLLLSTGWKDREIAEAFAARTLDMPVPVPPRSDSARDTFLHLLSFTAFYTWVVSLIILLFDLINLWLPDPALRDFSWRRKAILASIRWSLAAIVVAFPLFLFLWRFLLREFQTHPEKAKGSTRRWLTYLSLFLGAVTILSNTICLVYFLFEGELTLRFLLKVTVLFVVVGAVFAYLVLMLRSEAEDKR